MFVLIVSEWLKSDGDKFANTWCISQKLSKYISKSNEWKLNLEQVMNSLMSHHGFHIF